MHADNAQTTSTKPAARLRGARALRSAYACDRRTKTGRKLVATMAHIANRCGIAVDPTDALLLRAAQLAVAAEQARRSLIRREPGVVVDNVLRLEGVAARALRELFQAVARTKPADDPAANLHAAE